MWWEINGGILFPKLFSPSLRKTRTMIYSNIERSEQFLK
jgi:hypothetical protein